MQLKREADKLSSKKFVVRCAEHISANRLLRHPRIAHNEQQLTPVTTNCMLYLTPENQYFFLYRHDHERRFRRTVFRIFSDYPQEPLKAIWHAGAP